MFIVEDDTHAEHFGQFESFDLAFAEISRLVKLSFGKSPIQPPCLHWKDCERHFFITEYAKDWKELSKIEIATISQFGVDWIYNENADK